MEGVWVDLRFYACGRELCLRFAPRGTFVGRCSRFAVTTHRDYLFARQEVSVKLVWQRENR